MGEGNQGLQNNDGQSLEPSDLEGNQSPAPSQDNAVQDQLPEQDDRGVPAQNVLSEVLKKINKLNERFDTLEANQYRDNQNIVQDVNRAANPVVQQQNKQPINRVPRNPKEIAAMVEKETKEKFGEAMAAGTADFWEVNRFQNERLAELNSVMVQNSSRIVGERTASEGRVQGLYEDLKNPQSQLCQATFYEIRRRAAMVGMSPEDYYAQDPYVLENVAPVMAHRLGIFPKGNKKVKIKPLSGGNLPPQGFDGKHTPDDKIVPSAEDTAFEKRFGTKAETLAKIKKESPGATEYTDGGESLLS